MSNAYLAGCVRVHWFRCVLLTAHPPGRDAGRAGHPERPRGPAHRPAASGAGRHGGPPGRPARLPDRAAAAGGPAGAPRPQPAERPVVDAAALARDALAAARAAYPARRLWSSRPRRSCPSGPSPRPSSRCWATCSTTRPSTPPTRPRSGSRRAGSAPWPCWPSRHRPRGPCGQARAHLQALHPARLGRNQQAGGVGLGLYIDRQLANAQGGELLLADPGPPGQGARFELRLPMAELSFRRPG